ncbi:phosphofructokinase [Pseudoalteromonas phage HS1]|uniref:phosphofructokinase n=1 Tax=Pseudoalteromonas phage HS5 TaxID=1357709 RepID=UPI0023294145|nr:phosphofructokinase [Pseudoalteromonas phage HS5]YP_010660182.1 phosphofructokinase [Pseudoalteromonas phage HS1]
MENVVSTKKPSNSVSKVNRDIDAFKPKLAIQYLNECIEVQKQRGEQYNSKGTGERSFAAAASAFNAMTGQNLKGSDVCLMLACVKAVRQYSDPNRVHEDSLLDLVSYASLWAEELNKEAK